VHVFQTAGAERLLPAVLADRTRDDAPVERVELPLGDADVAAVIAFELPHEDVLLAAAVRPPVLVGGDRADWTARVPQYSTIRERELATVRQTREPAFRVIPAFLPEAKTDSAFDFLENLTWD
jgi:hypothetical protein